MRPFGRMLVALICLAVAATSCGKKEDTKPNTKDPKTAADYVARAKENFLDKDKAIKDLDRAIALDENYAPAYEHRAERYEAKYNETGRARDAARAISDYDILIDLESENPKQADWLRKRGQLKTEINDFTGAIDDFEAARQENKRDPKIYQCLADAYLGAGDNEKALKYCAYAIKYDRNNAALYKARAHVYYRMGQVEKSIPDLKKAFEIQPDAEGCAALAQIYREIGKPGDAIDWYEKAKTLDPSMESDGSVW